MPDFWRIKYKYFIYLFAIIALIGGLSLVFVTSGSDVISHEETNVLELEPAGEGTYTQIDDETGEIQIILTEENPNLNAKGVNPNAVTDIGPVFTVENVLDQQTNATVWISHDSVAVEFYVPGEGTAESQADGVLLQPGDSETIAMRIDTRETDEITLGSINVMAVLNPEVETGESGDGDFQSNSVEDSGDDDDSDTETPDSRETDTETESTPEPTGTATPTPNEPQSTPAPTAVDDGPTETDDQTDEVAGFGSTALLGIALLLAGVIGTMLLFRRLRGA
jgi:hypothetical protein